MNVEQRVRVLEGLLAKVRSRAHNGIPNAALARPTAAPAATRTSIPAPVLVRAAFASASRAAFYHGELSSRLPPRSFADCE